MREREQILADNTAMRALLREHHESPIFGTVEYEESQLGVATAAFLDKGELPRPFQNRIRSWMMSCFGLRVADDIEERCDRFMEEATELTQALGHGRERAHAIVDYVYDKDGGVAGEPSQEVGGTMVTLAALCAAAGLDLQAAAETELARVSVPEVMARIRAKQAAKPTGSALPVASGALDRAITAIRIERRRQLTLGFTATHDDHHDDGQLARAAACYALAGGSSTVTPYSAVSWTWPWRPEEWKPHSRKADLVAAGALIAAELERLEREHALAFAPVVGGDA